jgi:crotonobetainyl-CoA:carnitine CoA-transferase CaiB-like acyl-CoA transferase
MSALQGIRVVDFGHYFAGPLAALLLAEQGAEVIHIDRPRAPGPSAHDDAFLNRSKQRITLDLKQDEGRDAARRLVLASDVLIENFRPGVMERLQLGPRSLLSAAPHLIYCSLPGFAAADPRAGMQAWEGIVSAAAGLYNPTSPAGQLQPDASPYNELPLASNFAALQAATAVVMALIARERGAGGQWIEAPLFDGAMELLGPAVPETFPNYTIINGGGIYACAAGHVFLNCNNPRFLFWLLDAAGVAPAWRAEGLLDMAVVGGRDPALHEVLRGRLAEMFKSRSATQWEDLAALHHVPLSRMRTWREWQHSEAALASGSVVRVQDPELGRLHQPGIGVDLGAVSGSVRHARHPRNQDREALLAGLEGAGAKRAPETAPPHASASTALAGIRVLDLANIIAGPSVGRWLADFGAEVIKINDPRSLSVALHDYLNRGKKSALVDAKSADGRDVILKLAASADVFLSNFPQPTLRRYGLEEASVRSRRADIVYATVSCYGASGPWRERRGYEPQAQCCTGIMSRYGGAGHPVMLPYLVNDYGTGLFGAFGVGLALLARRRSAAGQTVGVSLAQTSSWHQWGPQPARAAQALYRAADGWLFIGAADGGAVAAAIGVGAGGREIDDAALMAAIAARIATRPIGEWLALLAAAGVAAMPMRSQREAMCDASALERGVTHAARPRLSGTLEHPGITVHLSRTAKLHGQVPEAVGVDLHEVLALGGLLAQMPELVEKGVVSHTLRK